MIKISGLMKRAPYKYVFACLMILISSSTPYQPVTANPGCEEMREHADFFSLNSITNYDLCVSECTSPGATAVSNVEKSLKYLTGAGMSIEQASGVVGNFTFDTESSSINPAYSSVGAGTHGIGIWGGERFSGTEGLDRYSESKNTGWKNIDTQLEFLLWEVGVGEDWGGKQGGDQADSWGATLNESTVAGATETWMVKYQRPENETLAERLSYADKIYSQYKEQDLTTEDQDSCRGGVVLGNIASTARHLAWNDRVEIQYSNSYGYGEGAAKPEYVVEAKKLTTNYNTAYFTDCGVFVATVMHASGVDKDYPIRGTSLQLSYVVNSSKYTKLSPKSEADLRPGDILIRDGHTYIYSGPYSAPKDKRSYSAVGASLYTRPPSGHYLYLTGSGVGDITSTDAFTVARYSGA